MSREDMRLACTHAHVNAIKPAFKANVYPFSLQFEHPADADCVPAAAYNVGRCGKKTCPTYVHYYQLFRISFFCWFSFAWLFSLSCNRRSWMSGEDRRLSCTHAHINAITRVQSEMKRGCKEGYLSTHLVWAWPDPLPICYAGKGLGTKVQSRYTLSSMVIVSLAQPDPLPNASLRRRSGDIAFNDLFPSPTFW